MTKRVKRVVFGGNWRVDLVRIVITVRNLAVPTESPACTNAFKQPVKLLLVFYNPFSINLPHVVRQSAEVHGEHSTFADHAFNFIDLGFTNELAFGAVTESIDLPLGARCNSGSDATASFVIELKASGVGMELQHGHTDWSNVLGMEVSNEFRFKEVNPMFLLEA